MKSQRLALPSSIALAFLAGIQTVAFGQTVARPAHQTQEPTEVQRSAPHKLAKVTRGSMPWCLRRFGPIR